MNKILLVDIDTATLNDFSSLLEAHPDKFEILTAGSAREVPNIVSGMKIGMIVIDLKMPDVDDLEFLAYMSKNYPKIPIIVMTAFGTPEIAAKISRLETCRYYQKPIDIDSLGEKIIEELESAVSGQIHGIGLSSFLQMSEMEKTTCKLKVKSDDDIGFLYLQKGELVDAELGLNSGNEAAFEIISWEEPTIEIEKAKGKRKKTITMPLMNILMEGMRIKDEKEATAKKAAEPKKKAVKKKKAAPKPKTAPQEATAEETSVAKKGVKVVDAAKRLKRNKFKTAAAALLLLVLIGVGGGSAWVYLVQPHLVEKEYNGILALMEGHTTLEEKEFELQNYIASHDGSPHNADARKKILEIRELIRERDFQAMTEQVQNLAMDDTYLTKAKALYEGYLKRYPGSSHEEEIQREIAKLPAIVDESDYRALEQIGPDDYEEGMRRYTAYLDRHQEGKYREEVKKKIAQMGEEYFDYIKGSVVECNHQNDWESCIQLTEFFLEHFEGHRNYKAAGMLKKKMQNEQVIYALKKKSNKEGVDLEKARKIYLDYLVANPDTTLNKRIQEELTRINRQIREKNTWERMSAYAQNRRVDVFERSQKLEEYIAEKVPSRYKNEADKLMKLVQREKKEEIRRRKLEAEEKRKEQERLAALKKERNRINREKQKIGQQLDASGGRFTVSKKGMVTDNRTGLVWYVLDSHVELQKCLDYDEARDYVRNLAAGGHRDWRLPTSNELLVMLNNEPYFPGSGATWYWTSEVYWKGYHEIVNIVKEKRKNQWIKDETDLTKCGAVRAVRP